MTAPVSLARAFALFAFAYAISYGLRAVNAAIGPEVAAQFALDAAFLGGMTAAYFAPFAVAQWPLGGWLDRFGPVRTESAMLLLAAAGCAVFAMAQSAGWLIAGRALIGAGVAAGLMAPVKAYRTWFAASMQGRLTAWMMFAGTLGAIAAASPAQWLTQQLGWRAVFGLAAVCILLAAGGLWFGLPRTVVASASAAQPRGLWQVLREPVVKNIAPCAVFATGGFIAVQTLWLGPWLRTVHGMSAAQAAGALTAMNSTMLAGFLLMGSVAPWLASRPRWLTALSFGAFTCTGVLFVTAALFGAAVPWPLWCLTGLAFTVQPVSQSRVTLTFASHEAGRIATTTNLLIFGSAFVLQWGMGAAIDALRGLGMTQLLAMQWTFGSLGVATVLSGLWGLFTAKRAYGYS